MAEASEIKQIVEQAVAQVLEGQLPQLREALVAHVLQVLPAQLEAHVPANSSAVSASDLLRAVSAIHAGATQKEILRALLDGTAPYSNRAALFVVKGGNAVGWQGRGFADNDGIKEFSMDLNCAAVADVMQSRKAHAGSSGEMAGHFASQFGAPGRDQIIVLPLLLKEKIAALVYADGGPEAGGNLDQASLELLVTTTSTWLETVSLRKQAQRDVAEPEAAEPRQETAPAQAATPYNDPFAGHTPAYAAAAHAPEPVAAMAAPAAAATTTFSPEEADTHRKAQRFARLLVDEIKLYNQVKVLEGRKNRDLYDRLKPDIEKSRSMYLKRYGGTVDNSADYFSTELVRSLAEDDSSLMGANFRH